MPPVISNAVGSPTDFWKVIEPPFVMGANIAIAPIFGVDSFGRAAKVGELIPVVAETIYDARIAPVIILVTVWGKVDVSTLRLARMAFVVANEFLPEIVFRGFTRIDFFHD